MGKHPAIVTTEDVARDMGISPQRVRELQRADVFHMAKLVNDRKRNYAWWDNDEFRRLRKNWRQSNGGMPVDRRQLKRRRRQQKIDKMLETLRNKTPVTEDEREIALNYYYALDYFIRRRFKTYRMVHSPLLEGIRAMFEGENYRYPEYADLWCVDLPKMIERLPTKPQTGQSSLNASA